MKKQRTRSTDDLLQEFDKKKNGKLNPYRDAFGNRKMLWWICENGHSWQASVYMRHKGSRCPKCSTANTSMVEQTLYEWFRSAIADVENRAQVSIKGKLYECDLYLPSLKFAIEYDGPHHVKKVEQDQVKNQLFSKGGIQIVRIRHTALPEIEPHGSIVVQDFGTTTDGLAVMASDIVDALKCTRNLSPECLMKLEWGIANMAEFVDRARQRLTHFSTDRER